MAIRMMIVDDEPLSIETMQEYLYQRHPDAQIRCYTNPQKALDAIRDEAADIAFLDIQMPGNMNGIQLAMQMKCIVPDLKVVFCTAYTEYALDAFRVHANGYLCKPIMKDALYSELEHTLCKESTPLSDKPFLQTFGNFDLFVHGEPVLFSRAKSKEVLARLTDRRGAWVSNGELAAVVWDDYALDTAPAKYASLLVSQLLSDLRNYGVDHILERKRGQVRLRKDQVVCDYYTLLAGDVDALNSFRGEYMSQYSWAENTLGFLLRTDALE